LTNSCTIEVKWCDGCEVFQQRLGLALHDTPSSALPALKKWSDLPLSTTERISGKCVRQ